MAYGYPKVRKLSRIGLACIISITLLVPTVTVQAETDPAEQVRATTSSGSVLDSIHFGEEVSEAAHDFVEKLSMAGVDDKAEAEYTLPDGKLAGGGIGDGLTYRYIQPSPDATASFDGKLEFTLKADTTRQNYLTIRASGTQQGRGNLLLYGPNGDKTVLNPHFGSKFSELDNGYEDGAPFLGRYYYDTYIIPQGLINSNGTVRLTIMSTGKFSAYGNNTYGHQTQNSKYIYSAATHTDPFFTPEDDFTGEIPVGRPAPATGGKSSYEHLQAQGQELLELIMSWQLYGPEFEAFKNTNNDFLEGATVTYTPVKNLASFNGATRQDWSKKVTGQAINYQNWSPMMASEIFTNAFINKWSGDYYESDDLLARIIKLNDFFARAQDSQGAWCVPTTGENAYKWIGAALDGSGERGTGENWPLLSLGTDSLVQSMLQLHNYIMNSHNAELKEKYTTYLDEKVDNDLTGIAKVTRRVTYIEMFARLRDYMYMPAKGDFYDPNTRAGTANQDFGFAYDANRAVQLLFDTMNLSEANTPLDVDDKYQVKDSTPYLQQLKYKFGEMVDGEKWFSDNGVGLEGGASHGGWAGEYGLLLLKNINKYAETAEGSPDLEDFLGKLSYDAYETGKYFFRPSVSAEGINILISEMYGGSRNAANGQKIAYQVGGYSAASLGSEGAQSILLKYIEDNRAFAETFKEEIYQEKTPHVYTRIIELQELLKYYKEAEQLKPELTKEGEAIYLPMEDGHPDFAWADPDAQAVVFKNKGEKVYITFNYRRNNWEYNNNTRIHFTTDKVDRLANVVGTSKGGIYTYTDSTTHPEGKSYTHTRADGYSQVRYGKYSIGMNQSKDDATIGQTGKVYQMDTLGIKKAKDLITGTVYESQNGKDIYIQVQPRQTVVLEVLEETKAYEVSVKYTAGSKVLKVENLPAVLGQELIVEASRVDGYKLLDNPSATIIVSSDNNQNVINFRYAENASPVFHTEGITGAEQPFALMNLGTAKGTVDWDENGSPIAITSTGSDNFSPTFAYQTVTGDFEVNVRLEKFKSTATDKDYFSLLLTDSADLKKANYVQLRHFPNNNNILLVSHRADQGDTIIGYWAGDMNNKKVPILFRIVKTGTDLSYFFSLDEGKTYQQTSKPAITFETADKMYVGAAMTSTSGVGNTAYISKLKIISDDIVNVPFETGKVIQMDLGVKDPDGDDVHYNLHGLPEGSTFDEASKVISWIPQVKGSYTLKAEAKDDYHLAATEKVKEVWIADSDNDLRALENNLSKVSIIRDIRVAEGETASFEAVTPDAIVSVDGNYPETVQSDNGAWTWNTKPGDAGVYHAVITYTFEENVVTKVVKITVVEAERTIDYTQDWNVELSELTPQEAVTGKEFVFRADTLVPVDGFGVNVSADGLPEGAVFVNRTLRWTPSDSYANTTQNIGLIVHQPNGKTTEGILVIHVAQGIVPTSLTLSTTLLELGLSETAKLQAFVLPKEADNKSVLWSTSNNGVASVDSKGRVKALADGQATITATTVSGKLTATASVYVGDSSINMPPVFAPVSPVSIEAGGTVTLNVYADDPEGGAVTFSALNLPDMAELNSSTGAFVWTPDIPGLYSIFITASDEAGNQATLEVQVTVQGITQAEGAPGVPVLSSDNGYDTGFMDGDYNITMNLWWGNNGTTLKLYEDGVLIGAKLLKDVSPSAQQAVIAVSGKTNGTYVYTAELTNIYGTSISEPLVLKVSETKPGQPELGNDNWDGDGSFKITMNLWWGINGTAYRLYENGKLIDTQDLEYHTPWAQYAETEISDRSQGTYTYMAELVNSSGITRSKEMTVVVKE
ncbi:hypothetical protein BSK62_11415 [Paenibacillus odorifer]|uniref:Ig-like domain-containing protein n=1 Tax=Paenibacillus odorifer TaxID=189426 RepID=UPI00096F2F64|nr:putative Ig domain-containing protein [Paenibacillus odorifer]OMD66581.1 hypothetical protein BSK62_11415 [Paenibacillus odorifer]